MHSQGHSQADDLASLLLDGSAKDFINALRPRPQCVRDLEDKGWTSVLTGPNDSRQNLRLEGFYIMGLPASGCVKLTIALTSKQPRAGDERLSLGLYDYAVWQPSIGASYVYWSSVKPVLLIWQKTLMFNLPPDDAIVGPPGFTAWKRNWNTLRKDLKLRENEKP